MTNTKLILLAFLFTGLSVVIGGGTAIYVTVRKVEKELDLPPGGVRAAVSTLTGLPEAIENIRGDADSEFGRRVEVLRRRHPFVPPPGGILTDDRIARYLAVRRELAVVDDEMTRDMNRPGGEQSVGNLMKWNFLTRLNRLRSVQAAALEEQKMPLEEYHFVAVSVLKASMAAGLTADDRRRDWAAEMQQSIDRSAADLDARIAASSGTERELLEQARADMEERRKAIVGLAAITEDELKRVPPENIAAVQRHRQELSDHLFTAIDLDAVDFFLALERSGARLE